MSHETIQLELSAFADGELSALETEEIRSHVAACKDCRRAVDEYRQLRAAVRASAVRELPTNFASNIARTARLQSDPQAVWQGASVFARRLVLALTIVVFFVVSVGSLDSTESQVVIEPGFSGVSVDSTAQKTLLRGEVSEDDIMLAIIER